MALILENGEIWGLYGKDYGSIACVYGFVQGSGVSSNGSYTSNNARDFGQLSAVSGTLTSTYNSSAKTLSGTVSNQTGSLQFSGGPWPSMYNYDTPASLSSITGMWIATTNKGANVSVNITASGTITTLESGCSGTGTIAPRPSGKNVFDVSLTFGPAPCAFAGQTGTGIATATPFPSGQMQFTAAMVSASRTAGVVVYGIR